MKKLVIIGIILAAFVTGCEMDNPQAQFSVDYSTVQPGEFINFTNLSNDAVSFLWDFGDGYTSTAEHPSHSYDYEGEYIVTLTVTSPGGKRDVISRTVSVYYTVLAVTAAEWNPDEIIEFIIPGALVVLYENLEDWDLDENAIAAGVANNMGEIEFYPLNPERYWIYVEALDVAVIGDRYDNIDFYDYFPEDYLQTYRLTPFVVNEWIAWADYFEPGKKSTDSRADNYDIEKIKNSKGSFIIFD